MKNLILSAIVLCSTFSFGQIEIYEFNDPNTDYSGGIYEMNPFAVGQQHVDFLVKNSTGSDQPLTITRVRINEINTWTDYLCWGNFGLLGNCYPVSTMLTNPWTTPYTDTPTIPNDSSGLLKIYIDPDITTSNTDVTYRYYVGPDANTFMDSVDVRFQWFASVDEKPSISVNVSPNPATSYVNVKADGVNSASVTLVDVLGNIVLNETMTGSKTINVSEFKNGIYFLRIEAEDVEAITRKIIVRH